jgi:hypothetical protein
MGLWHTRFLQRNSQRIIVQLFPCLDFGGLRYPFGAAEGTVIHASPSAFGFPLYLRNSEQLSTTIAN